MAGDIRRRVRFGYCWRGAVLAALAATLSGCGPDNQYERAYFAAREAERLEQEDMRRTLTTPLPDQEVLDLVREKTSPDDAGSTGDWLQRRLSELPGQVLFPRWQVARRGSSKYEVTFTFTWIDSTNHISSQGYAWTVDGGLKLVSDPRPIEVTAASPRAHSAAEKQQRRLHDPSYSLE